MRSRKMRGSLVSSSYDLSISDLMSALCCVFLLFLAVTVYKLNQQKMEYQQKNALATEYKDRQEDLYKALEKEFIQDLKGWSADIAQVDGAIRIRFTDDSFMFSGGDWRLTFDFETVLTNFFGRLIKIIGSDDFCDDILELRIEGHTKKIDGSIDDYNRGMEISMNRAKSVLIYCLEHTSIPYRKIGNEDAIPWIRKRIAGIGYSFSIPGEDKKDRRVEFKIRTKAESVIDDLQKLDGFGK